MILFQVRHKHFKDGDLKLKCTATISTVYWKSNEESVQESALSSPVTTSMSSIPAYCSRVIHSAVVP